MTQELVCGGGLGVLLEPKAPLLVAGGLVLGGGTSEKLQRRSGGKYASAFETP